MLMMMKGYTCPWQDSWMQPSGCCDQGASASRRFSCDTCDDGAGCCGVYELCVSCCMKEDNLKAHFASDMMKQLAAKDKEVYQALQDPFELCQMVCRTSSHSLNHVDGSAVFRSESLKYCYNAPTYPTPTLAQERAAAAVPGHPASTGTTSIGEASKKSTTNLLSIDNSDQSSSSSSNDALHKNFPKFINRRKLTLVQLNEELTLKDRVEPSQYTGIVGQKRSVDVATSAKEIHNAIRPKTVLP